MKSKKGFTLIELLVVIAVIGILSSIVLVNLSRAQDRAKDARMKSSLSQIRTVAEFEATPLGDYSDVCGVDTKITGSESYKDLAAMNPTSHASACNNAAGGWCVQATTNAEGTWCSDKEKVEIGSCGGTGNIVCTP